MTHSIHGGGLTLNAFETGDKAGPGLLFIHGLSQTYDAWSAQLGSPLAETRHLAAFDLRGHGASEKPFDKAAYHDPQGWADDVKAVVDTFQLSPVTLVAWSFGGLIALDYLKAYGEADVAGLVMVGALTQNAVKPAFQHLGAGTRHLKALFSDTFSEQYEGAKSFIGAMTAQPLPPEAASRQLAATMMTPPRVRLNLGSRKVDHTDTLQALKLPVLCIHGTEDAVILPSSSRHTLANAANATLKTYEGVGHMPFLEATETFNRDLSAFVERVNP